MEGEQCTNLKSNFRDEAEKKLLIKIRQRILQDLHHLNKTSEWLAWESEVSRSTIQRAIAAKHNNGILTLDRIAKGLGHKDLVSFLNTI